MNNKLNITTEEYKNAVLYSFKTGKIKSLKGTVTIHRTIKNGKCLNSVTTFGDPGSYRCTGLSEKEFTIRNNTIWTRAYCESD